MGCGPSTQPPKLANDISGEPTINGDVTAPVKYRELFLDNFFLFKIHFMFKLKKAPGEAFDVPLEAEGDESIIKKHPPKRIQKLLDERPATPQTIENLEAKLANAQMRRQKILLERINTVTKLPLRDTDRELAENGETQSDEDRDGAETVILGSTFDEERKEEEEQELEVGIKPENPIK